MYEVSGTPSTLNYLAYIVTVYSASHNVQNTYAVLIKIFKLKYWKNIEFIKVCSSPIFPLQIAPEHKTHPEKCHLSSSLRHKWKRKWSKLKTLFKSPVIIKEIHFQTLQDLSRLRVDTNLDLLEYIKVILAQNQGGTAQGCRYFRNFWTHLFSLIWRKRSN